MNLDSFQIIGLFGILFVFAVATLFWQSSRAEDIVRQWASANGFDLVSAEKRYFSTGPFFFRHSRGQFVYRIVVKDKAGATRSGWLRVGNWLAGVWSDEAKVLWDS